MTLSSDISLSGSLSFNATSVEISPITTAGTEWFERRFGRGAVYATVSKTVAMFDVIPALEEDGLTWSDPT